MLPVLINIFIPLGPVVWRPISTKQGLHFYLGFFHPFFSKAFSRIIFSIAFRAYPIILFYTKRLKKNETEFAFCSQIWMYILLWHWVIVTQLWTRQHWMMKDGGAKFLAYKKRYRKDWTQNFKPEPGRLITILIVDTAKTQDDVDIHFSLNIICLLQKILFNHLFWICLCTSWFGKVNLFNKYKIKIQTPCKDKIKHNCASYLVACLWPLSNT